MFAFSQTQCQLGLYSLVVTLCFPILIFAGNGEISEKEEDASTDEYLVGAGIGDFTRLLNGKLPHRVGTYGYVHYKSPFDSTKTDSLEGIINGVHLALKARAITIKHIESNEQFIYVLFDLAFPSENLRRGILKKINTIDPSFRSANLMLTATHTHSAPGGHSDYMGYEVATPGFKPNIVETIVESAYLAIQQAWNNQQPMEVVFSESTVPDSIPIAFSRKALPAYNSNPEITSPVSVDENYKATDRLWQMISFEKDGQLHSMLNLFGAHPNRMGSNILSADTRGAASKLVEKELPQNGVAIFAQNAPGDIDDEGFYRRKADKGNEAIFNPEYYPVVDKKGRPQGLSRPKRVWVEGKFLKEQAFRTLNEPETKFPVSGQIDCELIYVNMTNQLVPGGNYPATLNPLDYYTNDFYLLGFMGRIAARFRPKLKQVRTTRPTIGLGAIARIPDRLTTAVVNIERTVRYIRLLSSPFKRAEKAKYLWTMYRAQADKTVMFEDNPFISAVGFPIGGAMFNIFEKFDPVLKEFDRQHKLGIHEEHSMYPTIVPIQIAIIGNVAIAGVSGEPGNIAGQRIEKAILEHLKHRGVRRVIVNGYANENTGYIFTPEEYVSQFAPTQCGFVLYGKWTEPAFRFNFEKLAKIMLQPKDGRRQLLDTGTQPPAFSDEWYEKASNLELLDVKE